MKKEKVNKGVVKIGSGLPVFNEHAAGIDIGDTMHCVAISDGKDGHSVKITSAFTCDLEEIVSFCKDNGITTVAMESTGVYWLSLYILLEEAGIDVYLVNAKNVKNVSGRKKDDTDAVWIQKLHTCGLLQKSFQPDNETRVLRDYTRQRSTLISLSSDAVRRMQKALEQMNIKIHTVISDILGKTGMEMVKAIIEGERDPQVLITLCDPRIKASKEDILKSLHGIWKNECLFMLKQAVDNYEFHQKQLKECEERIKVQLLRQVAIVNSGDISCIEDTKKVKRPRKNQFDYNVNQYLIAITGINLCKIPGISDITALEFISEVGFDMKKWINAKHFAAWLNLVPNTKITGGKIISSKMLKKRNKAGQCLRQAASCLYSNKTPIGDYTRRIRGKLGGKGAVLATAHKLSRIIYTMMLNKTEYKPDLIVNNQEKYKENKIKRLEKQIKQLKDAS
jgi:transposase